MTFFSKLAEDHNEVVQFLFPECCMDIDFDIDVDIGASRVDGSLATNP